MKRSALLSIALGILIIAILVGLNDVGEISRGIADAGWGILAVIAFHPLQMAFSSLAWRRLSLPPDIPGLRVFIRLRWIREAVNALLPVAQIGGEFVVARLLALRGVPLSTAAAGVAVDLTLEMLSQIVFTLLGLGLLVIAPHDPTVAHWLAGGIAAAIFVVAAFIVAQRFGLFRWIERGLLWLAERPGWQGLGEAGGLHDAVVLLYKSPRRLWGAGGHHLVSWLLGGLEVMLALRVIDVPVDLRQGLIIESLGQAFRALGFAVPGALGIQEGGFILVCSLLGIGAPAALELSLLKRIREVALGVPGLLAWNWIEGRRVAARPLLSPERTP